MPNLRIASIHSWGIDFADEKGTIYNFKDLISYDISHHGANLPEIELKFLLSHKTSFDVSLPVKRISDKDLMAEVMERGLLKLMQSYKKDTE